MIDIISRTESISELFERRTISFPGRNRMLLCFPIVKIPIQKISSFFLKF